MEFKNKHSNINIEIVENITFRTMENVIQNKIDLGIICLYGEILKEKDELICDIIQKGKMKVYVQ
ncbi:hypothetical protein ACFVR2_09440 [Gottfriedia sp. NPDC057991]|uniref:hypothetical protein n=1 Tax=Gottfriedia sp. NPDC057991 TaxID=3346298 RepID=UPI0036D78658